VEKRTGDFVDADLSERCNRPEIVGDVIKHWQQYASDRKTLLYAIDRNHGKHLDERFREAGISCEYIDGKTELFEREAMFRRLESGETKVLCSIETIEIGVDLPFVDCIVDACPTKSRIRYVQRHGRGITAFPGKEFCLILDHAGNVLRLGMLEDISSGILDDGEDVRSAERQPEKKEFEAKLCPECHALQQPGARECWQCGHKFLAVTLVREREGELIELGRTDYEDPGPAPIDVQREWYAGFLWIAQQNGHKPGRAFYLFQDRFKHRPSWPPWQNPSPAEPTIEIRNFVRSKNIAFAKARQRYG
jgi:DNA repair protein RadD